MSNTSLTVGEAKQLATLEERIEGGITAFVDVGQALIAIRDKRLWSDHPTFEDYCKSRWGFSRSRAYQFIDSAKVIDVVSTVTCEDGKAASTNGRREQPILPNNERQVRELAKLDSPQKQADAWRKVVQTAPKDGDGNPKISAKHVADVVKEIAPPKPKPKAEPEKPAPKKPDADEGGYEAHEAAKPLAKMDALLTKLMEQQSAVEKILGKSHPAVAQIHAGLDSAYRAMNQLKSKLKKAG